MLTLTKTTGTRSERRPTRLVGTLGLTSLAAGLAALLWVVAEGKAQGPAFGESWTVQGTVRGLTTAPMGEVDGATLDDGTTLHWPPHLADRFGGLVARGDRVRAVGRMETGPAGDTHLEVQDVTNLSRNGPGNPSTVAPGENEFLASPRGAAERPSNLEQQLREMQEQIDQLRKEIRRLREDRD
jgi:hypothetical protein